MVRRSLSGKESQIAEEVAETEGIPEAMKEIIGDQTEDDSIEIEAARDTETETTDKEEVAETIITETVRILVVSTAEIQITEEVEMTDTETEDLATEEVLIATEEGVLAIDVTRTGPEEVPITADVMMTDSGQETLTDQVEEGQDKVVKGTDFLKTVEVEIIEEKAVELDRIETEIRIEIALLLSHHGRRISLHSRKNLQKHSGKPKERKVVTHTIWALKKSSQGNMRRGIEHGCQ